MWILSEVEERMDAEQYVAIWEQGLLQSMKEFDFKVQGYLEVKE